MTETDVVDPRQREAVAPALRWAGWSGVAMLAVVVVNGPLATLRGAPSYWSPKAVTDVETYLADSSSLWVAVLFFFLSTLIFVFAIPFFAGLRVLSRSYEASGLASGTVTLGAALFLAGGLVSEVMSAGMAMVVQAAPSYDLDANAAVAIQGLQFVALLQGQVGLGVLIIAVSLVARSMTFAPGGLVSLGLVAGTLDLLRPLAVTKPPIAIALFVPTFLWIALASFTLIRRRRVAT